MADSSVPPVGTAPPNETETDFAWPPAEKLEIVWLDKTPPPADVAERFHIVPLDSVVEPHATGLEDPGASDEKTDTPTDPSLTGPVDVILPGERPATSTPTRQVVGQRSVRMAVAGAAIGSVLIGFLLGWRFYSSSPGVAPSAPVSVASRTVPVTPAERVHPALTQPPVSTSPAPNAPPSDEKKQPALVGPAVPARDSNANETRARDVRKASDKRPTKEERKHESRVTAPVTKPAAKSTPPKVNPPRQVTTRNSTPLSAVPLAPAPTASKPAVVTPPVPVTTVAADRSVPPLAAAPPSTPTPSSPVIGSPAAGAPSPAATSAALPPATPNTASSPSKPAVPAPRPNAAATTSSVPRTPSDEQRIRAVLEDYRAAYEQFDPDAVKAVWPSVDARALSRAFEGLDSQTIVFDRCDFSVTGSSARAACQGGVEYVKRVGGRATHTAKRQWVFDLRKTDAGNWLIQSLNSN